MGTLMDSSSTHHSDDVHKRSNSTGKKHRQRHHRQQTSGRRKKSSIKTLDIDRFFFQSHTGVGVESNWTESIGISLRHGSPPKSTSPPKTKQTQFDLLENEGKYGNEKHQIQQYPVIPKYIDTDNKKYPAMKSHSLDEYSLSDLYTSDESVTHLAGRHGKQVQVCMNRNHHRPPPSAHPIVDYGGRVSYDENIYKSKCQKIRERKLSKQRGSPRISQCNDSKSDELACIEKYLSMCHLNYEQVETQINSAFSNLSNSINYRRKALIEEARTIRDRKINALNEAKSKCSSHLKPTPEAGDGDKEDKGGAGDEYSDETLHHTEVDSSYQGIHEPWNNGMTSNEGVQHKKEEDDDSVMTNIIRPGTLEEGNMTFHMNESESSFINGIGRIKEDLSSPQRTVVKGLTGEIRIIGDKIEFEVQTRNIHGEVNDNIMDRLVVRVYDSNKKKVPVETLPATKSSPRLPPASTRPLSVGTGTYKYSFTPLKAGTYEVLVKLNDIDISSSPFTFPIYTKSDLTFENKGFKGTRGDRCCSDSELKYTGTLSATSSASEDYTSSSCEEDPFYFDTPNLSERDWIVQKGGKSSILRSFTNIPSNIYATTEVRGMCAWHLRLTSACVNIVLNVGVKTRCGIPDLDEQFTCEFYLGSTVTNVDKHILINQSSKRKSSMFTRLSWTFTVLLNKGVVRVRCLELNEDQQVEIHLMNSFTLHPFCSMTHHHKGFVSQVCPRPQLTIL